VRAAHVVLCLLSVASLSRAADHAPVGAPPPPDAVPLLEFAFVERVTLDPGVPLGETALGRRQYIPTTGGTVAGPKLRLDAVRIRFYRVVAGVRSAGAR